MSDKHTLNLEAQVIEGKIVYSDWKVEQRIKEFKELNEGAFINVIFESHSAVAYFQHRYLYGYVLPQVAEAQGEKDISFLKEFVLKEKFLFKPCESFKDIPVRHRKRLRTIFVEYREKPDDDIRRKLVGYIPSTTVLTFKEMRDFIKSCEDVRDGLIDWSIVKENKAEYDEMMRIRGLAMSEEFDKIVHGDEHEKKM